MKKGYKLLNKLLIVYGLCILCFNDILNRTNFVKSLEINSPNLQLLVTNWYAILLDRPVQTCKKHAYIICSLWLCLIIMELSRFTFGLSANLCFNVDMNGPTEFTYIAYTEDHTLVHH